MSIAAAKQPAGGAGPVVAPDLGVAFVLSPRFTMIAFAGLVDCLRHAADAGDRSRQIHCRWSIVSPSPAPVEASCGATIAPWRGLPDPADRSFDYIAVVGGLLPWCLDLPKETYAYLRAAHARGKVVAGLCTGSFILGRAGLVDGRDCAVHVEHHRKFTEMFPRARPVTDRAFVRDGGIITCPGGTAAIDLAYAMIEDHCGRARAIKSMASVLLEKDRTLEKARNRPYRHLSVCGDWRVERAIDLMERNVSTLFGIAELASRIGSSVRELDRAFRCNAGESPSAVWRSIRLENAHWMLLNTNRSVTEIGFEYGFSDTPHFCRWFRRKYGASPQAFRSMRRWSGAEALR